MGEWGMTSREKQTQQGLSHVVVAGGTPHEWLAMSSEEWLERVRAVARAASAEGAHWVTVLPHHGDGLSAEELEKYRHMMLGVPGMEIVDVPHGRRFVWKKDSRLSVIVDPEVNGHERFAATVEGLRLRGVQPVDVSESSLSVAILEPATDEPDLVVVLGPADRIPDSMVWELAYSELVFLNLEWNKFESSHLELAIDDFNRRHRRFGGLDS
jgi:undecaprenyl diphosphate synthase